jgi:hypothetical protein
MTSCQHALHLADDGARHPMRVHTWRADAKFRDAFMLTYRSFMTPQELLRKLLHRYIGKFTSPDAYLSDEEREQQLHLVRIKYAPAFLAFLLIHNPIMAPLVARMHARAHATRDVHAQGRDGAQALDEGTRVRLP